MISCLRNLLLHLLLLHYFDQSFFCFVCVFVGGGGGWLKGVNDPRASFVRFCTQRGGEMILQRREEGLRIMY